MIRFSAALVAVAIGVLIGGIATSKLLLVYVAIVVSAVALVALAIGVVLKREELFGEERGLVPANAGASPVLPFATVGGARGGDSQEQARQGVHDARHAAPFAEQPPAPATQAGTPGGRSPDLAPPWEARPAQDQWARQPAPPRQPAQPAQPAPPRESAQPRQPAQPARTAADWDARPGWPPAGQDARRPAAAGTAPPSASSPSASAGGSSSSGRGGWNLSEADDASRARQAGGGPFTSPGAGSGSGAGMRSGAGSAPPSWFDRDRPAESDSGWSRSNRDVPTRAEPALSATRVEPALGGKGPGEHGSDGRGSDDRPSEDTPQAAEDTAVSPATAAKSAADSTTAAKSPADSTSAPKSTTDPRGTTDSGTGDDSSTGDASGADDSSGNDEDDDWPTRYSWLDDDEPADGDEPGIDAEQAETATAASAAVGDAAAGDASDEDDRSGDDAELLGEPTRQFAAVKPSAETKIPAGTDAGASASAKDDAEDEPADDTAGASGTSGASRTRAGTSQVTVVPGVPRYHEPNCILIRFMPDDDVQKMTIPEAKDAGCTPCAACEPEG